jgi:single-strand DNA-binding protein
MLNRSILIGRLANEPELKYAGANNNAVVNFRLAVERNFTNQAGEREADFIPIVVWGKQAEACANYLAKGRLCAVDGRIQVRSWEQDGERRYMTEVVAQDVRFLEWGDKKQQATTYTDNDIPF